MGFGPPQGGSGGGVSLSAALVTVGADGDLTAERALTAGTGISFTDGGANSTLTITNTGTTVDLSGLQFLTLATSTSLSAERVLTAGSGVTFTDAGANSTLTIANNLITGVSGGQTVIGGTASGDDLTLKATTNATDGDIYFYTDNTTERARILGSSGQLLVGATASVLSAALEATGTGVIGIYGTSTATAGGYFKNASASSTGYALMAYCADTANAQVFPLLVGHERSSTGSQTLIMFQNDINYGAIGTEIVTGATYGAMVFKVAANTGATTPAELCRLVPDVGGSGKGALQGTGGYLKINGGSGAGDDLYLTATSNASAGTIFVCCTGTTAILQVDTTAVTVTEAVNFALGTTTGTKFGTATTQKLGFYNATPIVQPSAYTQTYATADKTHANFTSADLATTAATQTTPWGFASQAQAENIATQFNALRVDVTDLKALVNSVIDDLQALGLAG